MAQYRKKPIIIEAIQFNRNNYDEIRDFTNGEIQKLTIEKRIGGIAFCVVPTLEGEMIANENDYIIKGVKGKFYPCKPDIFEATYEIVK